MSQQSLNDEKFEAIILQHTFAELSQEQKSDLGISDINAEEYEAIRSVIRELHALENDAVVPSAKVKDTLLNAFDEPPAKGKRGTILLWSSIFAGIAAVFIVVVFVLPRLNPLEKQGAQNVKVTRATSTSSAETSSVEDGTNPADDNPSTTKVQEPLLANNNTLSEDDAVLNEAQILEADNALEPPKAVKLEFENNAAGAAATEDMEMSDAPAAMRKTEAKASSKSQTTAGSLGTLGLDLLTTVY
jgi:hypothetical protein